MSGAMTDVGNQMCGCTTDAMQQMAPGGAPGGVGNLGTQLTDAAVSAGSSAAQGVASDVVTGVTDALSKPVPEQQVGYQQAITEKNPLALAAMAGFKPGDYGRAGGVAGPTEDIGKKYDARGQLYSDTGELLDRTMSDGAGRMIHSAPAPKPDTRTPPDD